MNESQREPGWYAYDAQTERYWDGTRWTNQSRQSDGSSSPQPPSRHFVPPLGVNDTEESSYQSPEVGAAPRASQAHETSQTWQAQRPVLFVALIGAALLLVAMAPLPIGFYGFLRLVITIAAIWTAIAASKSSQAAWVLVATVTAIVFNPLIPVWLTKEIWVPIDFIGAITMAIAGFRIHRPAR